MASSTKAELVMVTWHDAWSESDSPVAIEDAGLNHAPTAVQTLGWLLYQDPTGIQLANERYDSSYRGRTFIPAGMIVEVVPFTLARKRTHHEKAPLPAPGAAAD